ncbi:MAG: hypothetical protein JST00_00805 [Deltaproteobacteria bacterium]|nr:hypothetical protein [Deltaproteobacteria bacterium]
METRSQRVRREDLLLFVNACFACTGQKEFYSDGTGQQVSIGFLHQYVLGNYRRLYARVLACGVNHFNQALILTNLLASGKLTRPEDRAEESALVSRALATLPTNRAMDAVLALRRRRVNNRRTRAIVKRFLGEPKADVRDFRAVKYRDAFRLGAMHAHMPFEGELRPFFLRGYRERKFETPLFESFRKAHFAESAIYDLPFTIAEGLAAKHGVPREIFLERIAPRLTLNERLRLQNASEEELGDAYDLDWERLPPTRLATFLLSMPLDERRKRIEQLRAGIDGSAARAARRMGVRFGKVAIVLDRSFSTSGSRVKRNRPLAVALAVSRIMRAAAAEHHAFWTTPPPDGDELLVNAYGSTDLVTPIVAAMKTKPDLLLVVSDGYDNDPPAVAGQALEVAMRLDPKCFVLHVNPVFDTDGLAPRSLSPNVPTLGIRDGEDIATLVAFARFARAQESLAELDAHLDARVKAFLGGAP